MRRTTWILVADGARARIISRVVEGFGACADTTISEPYNFEEERSPGRELTRERPTRVHDRFGPGRHAVEPKQDASRKMVTRFATEIADMLSASLKARGFDRLIVVAPPAMLGDLRKSLSNHVRAKVIAEIDKDMTKAGIPEVMKHIEAGYIG
ncbi:conserved protein of unknown function [Candidatus Filomicrobium marinum]|uniref:Host attachment protein n=2 Tax=Filomicrobium TaxID=119044 RepID=A0A0D6JHF8_9HYPH|nr:MULTISPECIES: host attachment protein [Filomicrobium]CFX50458.1 conserved protein of unknown function [Candidatus Filomicrobium marinum]CPR20226.1 conserved protein of unknown function [Candidatus Filomicrobium marinum]SDP12186.1 Protein required for attachment to host cells [Filomicrobium insigne]